MKQRGFRYCNTCKSKLQKRGLTTTGKQRWKCIHCSKSSIKPRDDLTKAFILDRFVVWLLGKQSQVELKIDVTDRTWRSQTSWCWNIIPRPELTGEVYEIILIDGIRVGSLVCLIARTPSFVIAWHWVAYESSYTWSELLTKLPPPTVVVCDGQKGILLATARCWENTRVQRCNFHVWQNIRVKLTLHPQTEAGVELLQLAKDLLRGIKSQDLADQWIKQLKVWEQTYGNFIKERTYVINPALSKRKWWYTHKGLRSAYRQLDKLLRDKQLFTYLETDLTIELIPRTTNYVEGGINSQLRTKLKLHRGMNEEHQRRLVEWYLHSRTNDQKPPRNFL
jgi:hypothetical protein